MRENAASQQSTRRERAPHPRQTSAAHRENRRTSRALQVRHHSHRARQHRAAPIARAAAAAL